MVLQVLRSKAPIQPAAYYGGELLWKKILRLRRLHFFINVGHPFTIDTHGEALSRNVRQEITDEIMFQLCSLAAAGLPRLLLRSEPGQGNLSVFRARRGQQFAAGIRNKPDYSAEIKMEYI